jgi:pyruvate/2-oxoglutarate dehydrogenase complex dihydrolipoamide acyltransferase (E2) component
VRPNVRRLLAEMAFDVASRVVSRGTDGRITWQEVSEHVEALNAEMIVDLTDVLRGYPAIGRADFNVPRLGVLIARLSGRRLRH